MKGKHHPANDNTLNPSGNDSIRDVIARVDPGRRRFIRTSMGAGALAAIGGVTLGGFVDAVEAAPIAPSTGFGGIGFESVPPNLLDVATGKLQRDLVSVPNGYRADVLIAWGDPIMPGAKNWDPAATQDAAEQEKQYGAHNDGMHYFPLPSPGAAERGLLCVNHEYTDENLLHGAEGLNGGAGATLAKVRKSQAAHGVSVIEVFEAGKQWRVQRASRYGRRITANAPMRVSGPAAGHDLLRSRKYRITPTGSIDGGLLNDGFTAYGTVNNCAHGYTPWGTYITCEENWNGYFGAVPSLSSSQLTKDERRLGVTSAGFGYRWHETDERWDIRRNPKEQNLFGWRVEIDPYDPDSVPVKRTALGRFKCESAQVVVDDDRRVAFYMGDDERNEYVYKFVCARPFTPNDKAANRDMLDHGTLYVARFAADGTGTWVALLPGTDSVIDDPNLPGRKRKLRELPDFQGASDAEVQALIAIRTRMAADAVGATMMDRPEWCAARPRIGGFQEIEVYCTLTNNSRRGNTPASSNQADGTSAAASANPPVDAANPRPDNDYGHIVRWREDGRSVAATTFRWDLFVLCGDRKTAKTLPTSYSTADLSGLGYLGNIDGDDYGAPDGLWFDDSGRLWIQTDQAGDGKGDWANIGSNVMMCADPNTRQTRRFLTSPTDCEVTGVVTSPDGRAMFVNIQHPGDRATPEDPTRGSHWPYSQGYGPAGRPRSATVAITRDDGGVIGGP